jgi:PD-(D/E)XK nuclease superfamily
MSQQIEQLLNEVGFKIATLREARNRFADQLAPEFRIFDYLRTDEMGLSRCIAGLLDPKGKHGQGSLFLKEFLKTILGEGSHWETKANDLVNIVLEKQANGQRRIDIYLEFQNGIIGIENKPWAGCQDNQLSDYADYLQSNSGGKNWLLVFLSKRDPENRSITTERRDELENDGRYIQLNYTEIVGWLEICAFKANAPVVRVFIEELAKFIRTYINGEVEMSDANEIKSAVLKSPKALDSAFQIYKAMDDVKKELLKKFRYDLNIGLKEKDFNLINWTMGTGEKPIGFDVQFCDIKQSLNLRFDFETLSLGKFTWGIWNKSGEYNNPQAWVEIKSLLNAEFYSGKSSSPWWPWYSECPNQDFDSDMKDWSISAKPWLMIKEERLAPKIIEVAIRVHETFKQKGCLHLLCESGTSNA